MHCIKYIVNRPVSFGGQEHCGWLPDNAVRPSPTPQRIVLLDLTISQDATGYLLVWHSRTLLEHGDTWHETLADAERQAAYSFGIESAEWLVPEVDESNGSMHIH